MSVTIETEKFVSLLVGILAAMPPKGVFCKIVKSLAETDAWADLMGAGYDIDTWEEDQKKMVDELKEKFGPEIEMEEVIEEWEKEARKPPEE